MYILILLPDPNPTRYPVFCPIPDLTRPDIEKPYPLGTDSSRGVTPGINCETTLMQNKKINVEKELKNDQISSGYTKKL